MDVKKRIQNTTIIRIEILVSAHATEDLKKVEKAVYNLIIKEARKPNFKIQRVTGHHNDPIALLKTRITEKNTVIKTFQYMVCSLSKSDRMKLLEEIQDRVDNAGNLYLRLDKQCAYLGRVELNEADPIRMKFKFRLPHKANPIDAVYSYIVDIFERSPI